MYRIKNWEKYQHYGDKKQVPWVKLYFKILTSEAWIELDDSHRCLMIVCILHASENKGSITKDEHFLKNLGRIYGEVSFKSLLDKGFIEEFRVYKNSRKILDKFYKKSHPSVSVSISESLSKGGVGGLEKFDEFWGHFPKQRAGAKDRARIAWEKALRKSKPDEIISGCMAYASSDEVKRGYAKGCAAWLNDDRWQNNYAIQPKEARNDNPNIPNANTQQRRRQSIVDSLARITATGNQNSE